MSNASDKPLLEIALTDQLVLISETDISNQQADIYIWEAEESTEQEEHISHFTPGQGGDVLQLNDLLIDQKHTHSLEDFLHFRFDGHHTTIEIKPEGSASNDAHYIVLDNVDLSEFGNSDHEIIRQLMALGNLDIVGAGH